jgi:dTDP-4-amino-4,6-dideoxygalactose transaminase
MDRMKKSGILTVFHYLPLHTSPMGKSFGYKKGDLAITEDCAQRLLRLPLYNDLTAKQVSLICSQLKKFI